MKIINYDQFEFDFWEGEEYLVIASENKIVCNNYKRCNNISEFFELTQQYDNFSFFDEDLKFDISTHKISKVTEVLPELSNDPFDDIQIDKNQKVYILSSDWNHYDLIWEDSNSYYRVLGGTTA